MDEDEEPIRSGRWTKIAAWVLGGVFLSVPVLSVLFAVTGHSESSGDWAPTLIGFGLLAFLAALCVVVSRILRARAGPPRWDDDFFL